VGRAFPYFRAEACAKLHAKALSENSQGKRDDHQKLSVGRILPSSIDLRIGKAIKFKIFQAGTRIANQKRRDSFQTCSQYVILSYFPESSSHVSRLPVLR
jgi:hypothetical protein